MKSLIIVAHPEPVGITETAMDELTRQGAQVRIHDLYAMRFQPALQASDFTAWGRGEQPTELQPLQADIAWAELLILVYPVRLGGTPAMLKGYIDRVLAQGFAYGVREGKMVGFLAGKRAILCPIGEEPEGLSESMRRVMGAATLAFCGVAIEPAVARSELAVRQQIRAVRTARL